MKTIITFLLLLTVSLFSQPLKIIGSPELFAPGIVSVENSEIKITFSKDGKLVLWGSVGREKGMGGFDIWQAIKAEYGWTDPKPVSFNTHDNDFDPCFSSDGKVVYFFSNRPGGFGGDDIYYVEYDSLKQVFGIPANIGNKINTAGDEWGPNESIDGKKFLFCTDGLGGKGHHDIFICNRTNEGWSKPAIIDGINFHDDDFDPVFLQDSKTIIFTRKFNDNEAYLFITYLLEDGYTKPEMLQSDINISNTWNFGSSLNPFEHSYFYYSTHNPDNTQGRLDIYKVKYILEDTD